MAILYTWTVYDHPLDDPEHYVARCFEVGNEAGAGTVVATQRALRSTDLEVIRDQLEDMGLVRLMRNEEDDSVIIETWL